MTFPASATALGKVVQSSEGVNSETYTVPSVTTGYHLGAGLSPAQPAGWVNVPDGAFPITPPAAPTTGTGTGFAGGGLTANGAYTWALTSVTDYGETPAGAQLVVPNVGSFTGYILNLPAVTEGTTDNPVRKRRLYRTVNGGAQLKYVAEIADLNLTTWHDALPDLQLGDNVPTSNTSGVTGTVTLSGGGVSVWTERSPTLAQASMASGDFVVNRQTGNIIHATSDYARTGVTVQWSGATLDTAQLVRDHINAVRDIAAAAGAAGGLATLDAGSRVVQAPPAGFYRNVAYQQNTSHMYIGTGTSAGTTAWLSLTSANATDFPQLTRATRGGTLRFQLNGHLGPTFGTTGSGESLLWRVSIDNTGAVGSGALVYLGMVQAIAGTASPDLALTRFIAGLAAGSHTFQLEFQISGSTQQWQCLTDTNPQNDQLVFSIDEF